MTRLDIYNVLIIMSFALLDSLMMKLIAVVVFLAVYTSTGLCSPVQIGDFVTLDHLVSGTVYVDDNSTIRIENFNYDGFGPAAYMYYYAHGIAPSGANGVKIPIPASAGGGNDGRFGLGGSHSFSNEQLVLTMPAGHTVHDIGHLTVWCEAFNVFFTDALEFPAAGSIVFETPTEPPTEVIVTILPLQIDSFKNTQHAVAGTVYADNNSTIRIENFHYDGLGPAAYMYYYAKGVTPSGANGIIIPIPASVGGGSDGRFGIGSSHSFSNEQLVLTMPEGSTVHDIGHLVIWCEAVNVFFNTPMQFPDPLVFATNITTVIVNTTTATPTTPTEPPVSNCVPLSDQLQLTWSLDTTATKPSATFTLCGCLGTEQYMAFGLSGSSNSINMVNGDVTVAWVDSEPHAEDYYLQGREQCRDGVGVCPDKISALGGTCKEDNFNISSVIQDGVTCVTYSRYLDTGDTDCDTVLDMAMLDRTYIIWALGPLGVTAFQHFERSGFSTLPLNLTREPVNECTAVPSCANCTAFSPSFINATQERTFTAEIGVSGGLQGYLAITGQPGWGIAWYIDGLLVPELTLTRGENYTFRTFGGNDSNIASRASYHPFYITDSLSGGRLLNTPEQRMNETVYSGFDDDDQPTGVGTYCVYNEGNASATIRQQCGTVQQYLDSLVKTCNQNPPVSTDVVFSPDETTPNVVYYQCATHINLGWRINIVDPVNTTAPTDPTAPPSPTGSSPVENCITLHDRLQLSWTLNTTASQPSATFTLCGELEPEEYMAFGLSGSQTGTSMDNGDVTIAWVDDKTHAEDYFLQATSPRSSCTNGAGVCPDATSNQGSTCTNDNFDVYGCVQDGVTCVTYSRLLKTDDTDCDSILNVTSLDQTYIIWALGPRGTAVMRHSDRGGGFGGASQPLDLMRNPVNECTRTPNCTKPVNVTCDRFQTSRLNASEGTSFVVDVGPSGGARGYSAITGRLGGELAWYINGLLVPELTLTRGEKYTFEVFGGSLKTDGTSDTDGSHPFYITNSPSGGRLRNQGQAEQVYAGYGYNGNRQEIESTFCSYIETSASGSIQENCGTIRQYVNSLDRSCEVTPPIPNVVEFTPNGNTPNVVYYQSATQENMGWKINIVGSTSAGAMLTQSWMMIITVITIAIFLLTNH